MAIGQPTRSRRFIKVYLALWAFAAVGALGYLATLAYVPSGPPRQQLAEAEPSQAVRAMAKAMKDMHEMRGSVSEVKKDVAQLQDAMGERVANEKAAQSRLTALEEKVATIDAALQQPATPPPPPAKAKVSDKTEKAERTAEKVIRKAPDVITTAQIINSPRPETAEAPKVENRAGTIETGSISKGEITFGEGVVTPNAGPTAPKAFAVQLAASPSLQGLRQSWSQLVEKHGALASLQPRVVPPRAEGGHYRLLAGPIASKADADRVCTEMGVGRNGCFATNYIGGPL